MHYVQHFLKDYVDDFAHPCISLLKCLYISHPSFFCRSLLMLQNECICCKLFCLTSHLYSLACACVRIYLGGSEDSMLCTLYWNANPFCARTLGSSLLIFRTFLDPFDCLLPSLKYLLFDILLQSLDPQYSLISLHLFFTGYVHLISLILWEMHTLWGSSYYIGLLKFSSHSGNRCQWGRSLEGLRKCWFYALVSFLSICLSYSCILALCGAWLLNSLYKPS